MLSYLSAYVTGINHVNRDVTWLTRTTSLEHGMSRGSIHPCTSSLMSFKFASLKVCFDEEVLGFQGGTLDHRRFELTAASMYPSTHLPTAPGCVNACQGKWRHGWQHAQKSPRSTMNNCRPEVEPTLLVGSRERDTKQVTGICPRSRERFSIGSKC